VEKGGRWSGGDGVRREGVGWSEGRGAGGVVGDRVWLLGT